ncbi:MAG: glycosyltransferase [Flavobacteriales bacterium]
MRLLMLAAASSVHTMRWANAFVQRGVEVHLLSLHDPVNGLDGAVRLHRLPYRGGLGYLSDRPAYSSLVRTIRPDVINAHYATGYGTLARGCGDVPLVLNVWGSDVYDFPGKSPFHRWWLLRNLRGVDHIVSTSEAMATRTKGLGSGLPPITVVPFGVDTKIFSPAVEGPPARDGEVVIGTVKSLTPTYGVDTLVKAFAELLRYPEGQHARLRIVGRGAQQEELEQLVRSLGIEDRVRFVGAVPHVQVPDELRKLDVFVALSREESFGVAVIEASSCGLPVLVSDAGGLPEVVEHEVTGAVVRRDDPIAAADRLRALVSSKDLRHRWGAAGRAMVIERYEWSACVDRMVQVLEQVSSR